jgi:hypothetical protein
LQNRRSSAFRARRVPANTIRVDGRLDEQAWANAVPAGDFVQQQPAEGSPATHQSEVRFLYDDTYLYIGARLVEDERPRLVVNELRRDFNNPRDGDLYIVILDTFRDKAEYGPGATCGSSRICSARHAA